MSLDPLQDPGIIFNPSQESVQKYKISEFLEKKYKLLENENTIKTICISIENKRNSTKGEILKKKYATLYEIQNR